MTRQQMIEDLLLVRSWHHGTGLSVKRLDGVIAALKLPEPPPGSIRVRIAVAVANYPNDVASPNVSNGLVIGAVGVDEVDDEKSAMEIAIEKVCDSPSAIIAQAFIEVDIPRIPTVQGRVVDAALKPGEST